VVGEITANRPAVQEICGKKSAIDVLEKFEGKTLPRLYSAFKAGGYRTFREERVIDRTRDDVTGDGGLFDPEHVELH
jgi:hypothetical protein